MQIVLVRVGIDMGSGGIHGPLLPDGSFEFIPIPDRFRGTGVDSRTYGNTHGRHGRLFIEYFPSRKRSRLVNQPMHFDPEFETFTYGDPSRLKSRMRNLRPGDLVAFYAGLQPGNRRVGGPALYIVGYFEVAVAGRAGDFTTQQLQANFSKNFHVLHRNVFARQKKSLVLVKGHEERSRLLQRAYLLSEIGKDSGGRPLHVLSRRMQRIFGDFGGHIGIQRSSPRWVHPEYVAPAARYLRSLE